MATTIAKKISTEITTITDTKVISISEPTHAQYIEVYYISKLGKKISKMVPNLTFLSFDREHLMFANKLTNVLIEISIVFDSIYEILEIVCDIND